MISTIDIADYCAPAQIQSNIATCAQSAINAAQALAKTSYGGAVVYFPAKLSPYKLTGTLVVTSSFVKLQGDGKQATFIDCSGNTAADCLRFVGGSAQIRDVGVSDMTVLGSSSATAGAAVHIQHDVDTGNNSTLLRDVTLFLNGNGNADYGIYWHDKADGTSRSDILALYNVVVAGGYKAGSVGLLEDGYVQTVVGDGLRLLRLDYGMRVVNSAGSATTVPAFADIHDLEIEGARTAALSIEAGSEWKFADADITNMSGAPGQGSADTYAVQCLADASRSITRGLMISNGRLGLSQRSGLYNACRDTQITNVQFVSTSEAGRGLYPVIDVAATGQDQLYENIRCEEFGGLARASYCINVANGAQRISAAGFDPQYANGGRWWNDANAPGVLSFQVASLSVGNFFPATDGATSGLRLDQSGVTNWKVANATTGASVQARYDLATGTANAYASDALVDNAGTPYAVKSFGPSVRTYQVTLPVAQPTYAYATPSAGGVVAIGDQQDVAILNPAGPVATLTVKLPTCSALYDGKSAGFSTTQAIAALTVSAAAGAVNSAPTSAAANSAYKWRCVGSQSAWFLSY
jgi:hypothetical protein